MAVMLTHEVFAMRDGEVMTVLEHPPETGRWIAVMIRSVKMPEGEYVPTRPEDGAPVEQAAILACERNATNRKWQWIPLSPPTKERIGDLLFDNQFPHNQWLYLAIT